jgi:hypothetical protein
MDRLVEGERVHEGVRFMPVRQSIVIAAGADAVWTFVADPLMQSKWNLKIVSVDRRISGPARFGERFGVIYRMSGRPTVSQVEVTACQPPLHIVFQHKLVRDNGQGIVDEAYTLKPSGHGFLEIQTNDLTRTGISWIIRGIIGLVGRLGRSVGPSYFHQLKALVERSAA